MKCDFCNSEETYVKKYTHEYIIKGEKVVLNANRRFCSKCNNLVYDADLDNEVSKKALELYSKKYGIFKDDIINLRHGYNLSQELFAKVIGCAKKTLVSYENGQSIPNDSYLIIIKTLIENPKSIYLFIEANKDHFSKKDYDKLNEKLGKITNNIIEVSLNTNDLNEFNGYTRLLKEKVNNIIIFLADGGIFKTKLLKEMFYADFINYKNTGKSMTGLKYVKLPYGPVPDNFESILVDCINSNLISYESKFYGQYESYVITSKRKVDADLFSKEEIELLKKIKEIFNSFGSKEIANYSHEEKAYKNTNFKDFISYDYAFDISIFDK